MMFSDLAANCIVLCCPASVTMPVSAEVDVRVVIQYQTWYHAVT